MKITEEDIKFVFQVMVKNIAAFEAINETAMGGKLFEDLIINNKKAMEIMFPREEEK
jgi:hypothetical protein